MEVPGFEQVEPLDRGGFGTVYRALRTSTGGVVTIKVLDRAVVDDEGLLERRLRREIAALIQLKGHPNVVQVEEVVSTPLGPGIVMEFMDGGNVVDGTTLPMTPERVVEVGVSVVSALAAAHGAGIVHRDVKPKNVLTNSFGQVKLCDFGIAAIVKSADFATRTTSLSVQYASPEELDDAPNVGPPTDVYSLGATLHHLLSGTPPSFRGGRGSPSAGVTRPRSEQGTPERELWTLIEYCMQLDPLVRPTARQVKEYLADMGRAGTMTPQTVVAAPPLATPIPLAEATVARRPPAPSGPVEVDAGAPRNGRWPVGVAVTLGALLVLTLGTIGFMLATGDRQDSATTDQATISPVATEPPDPVTGGSAVTAAPVTTEADLVETRAAPTPPAPTSTQAPPSTLAPTTLAPPPPPTVPPAPVRLAGDLGLTRPITQPPCLDQAITVVGSAVTPAIYGSVVGGLLDEYPGSEYLKTAETCPSLRPFFTDGSDIYVVYYGPFDSISRACTERSRGPQDAYVKLLDFIHGPSHEVSC